MQTTKGFTLIEMIMVIVITGIITSIVSMFLYAGFQSYFTGVAVTGLVNEASTSMTRVSKELQRAINFTNIGSTSVSFTMGNGTSVTYSLSGTNLNRVATSTQPLSNHVSAFSLNYYDSNYAITAVLANVRAITLTLILADGVETIPLINTVYLRNMS